MCNNCIHKPVCSKYIATGGVNSCEHFKEERKGRWVIEKRYTASRNPYMDDNYHAHATCSECGFCIHSENASFGYPKLNTTNYCPNCGADMRGELR